ncbi:bacterial Ig-like domain protein [Methanobrevibacter oralis]|uniref:Bacterial Ig-like domain protein n=1 Tax=Methanobrevibacter oralis TaxID=66851 RepID=A0A162FHP7_METOA|nr:Ig-like domain-containing protein [Methanobrevibacter oralis]KZX13215.1 bacterial Ig-like domain protein [Methanobrevibacter oralis]
MKNKSKLLILLIISLSLILTSAPIFAENTTLKNDNEQISLNEGINTSLKSKNVIYISPNGTGSGASQVDPTNWNNAYSSAKSGDTIVFANGTYNDIRNVKGNYLYSTIINGLELKGNGDSIIDACGRGGFFETRGNVKLSNLKFINANTGKNDGGDHSEEGGIINNGYLTVENCYFASNVGWGSEGGAIHNQKTCHVYNSSFFSNTAKKGGSIYAEEGSELYVYNSKFIKGSSKEGNSINAKKASVNIYNCTFVNCSAKSGIISVKKSTLNVYNSKFLNSRAVDEAAAINIKEKSRVEIHNSTFDNLTSTGGKLWTKNKNGSGNSGAIRVENGCNLKIKDSRFTNCVAKMDGGALYIESGYITIENCSFLSNKASRERHIYNVAGSVNITNSLFEVINTISTSNISVGEVEKVEITVDDGTNLLNINVNVLLNNKTVIGTNDDVKDLENLTIGVYTVNLAQKDNINTNSYIYTQNYSLFSVKDDSKIDVPLKVEVSNITVGSEAIFNLTLSNDANGGIIEIIIENITLNSIVKDSKAIIKFAGLKEGIYNYSVFYKGNDKCNPTSFFGKLKVNKILTVNAGDITRGFNSGIDFEAIFYSEDGSPLKNTVVRFVINSKEYSSITDLNGVAKLNEKLKVGFYKITAINPVTGDNITKTLKIVKRITSNKDLTMDYNGGNVFKVRIYGDNGKLANSGEIVIFKINGKSYKVKTDKNAYANLKINLLPKSYKIITTFKGEQAINTIFIKQILKAKNIKVKKAKIIKFKATLKSSNGKAIKNKKITFKINGKTYSSKTNKKGIATVSLKNLKLGKHTVKSVYIKNTIKNTIQIKK